MSPPTDAPVDGVSDTSSITDPLDTRDDEGWEDLENDEEAFIIKSLFDEKNFPTAQEMFTYCRTNHDFDIWKLRQQLGLEFLDLVRLVNYVRSEVASGNVHPDITSKTSFDDEKYLKPFLEDDALLYSLDDVFDDSATVGPAAEVERLRDELESLQAQFSAYREQVQKAMFERLEQAGPADNSDISASKSNSGPRGKTTTKAEDLDTGYFQSYSYNAIHESMIKDRVRTDAYRDFIYDHKHLFKDKIVLDVGCGTGILSMFCAKAGAKLVLAVDNSDIIDKARENVFKNGLQDTVKCLRGKIEEITLTVAKVDIIVSEWMGYALLYESMLDSVIYARDRYLAPDGLMVPSHASLRIAPLADSELKSSHIDFWRHVYGFDMTAMLDRAHEEALVRVAEEQELAAENVAFLELDLHTTKVQDLTFTKLFQMKWKDDFRILEGFVVWFDIIFGTSRNQEISAGMTAAEAKKMGLVSFSTGPHSESTHWQQCVFLIKDPVDEFRAGDEIDGEVTYVKKQDQERSLDIEISWTKAGTGKEQVKKQLWVLD